MYERTIEQMKVNGYHGFVRRCGNCSDADGVKRLPSAAPSSRTTDLSSLCEGRTDLQPVLTKRLTLLTTGATQLHTLGGKNASNTFRRGQLSCVGGGKKRLKYFP